MTQQWKLLHSRIYNSSESKQRKLRLNKAGLKLRLSLNFNAPIVLHGFIPEASDQHLNLTCDQGRYSISVYVSDRSSQLEHVDNRPIPTDSEELRKRFYLGVRGLTLEIEDATPQESLLTSLKTNDWTEQTRQHVADIVQLAYRVKNGIVEYFRNLGQQSWLEYSTPDGLNAEKSLQFVLHELRVQWLDPNQKWQPLTVGQKPWMMRHRNLFMDGVDAKEWCHEVKDFMNALLDGGKKAPITDVLIANSLRALDQQNGRLAIIEAVIALEGVVRDVLPRVLESSTQTELDRELFDQLIMAAGLRLSVKVILKANVNQLKIEAEDIDLILKAIETRNTIVHNKQRDIDIDQAEEFVSAIQRVIARLRRKNVFRRAHGVLKFKFPS